MATATRKPWTAEELERLPDGWRYEIDEGELVIMTPAGWRHNRVVTRIARLLGNFVEERRLGGEVITNELGILLRKEPVHTLRAPDVAYFTAEQVARIGDERGFPAVVPALVVEVHDASEPEIGRKVAQYLAAGVRAVWVVDLEARTLTRHGQEGEPRTWSGADAVIEEPVLPGFSCRLSELLG
ncbi:MULTISPECIES: Uma2 family endonuclease [Thermaerobacter]|uniref:Uma2 family endonuclease n=1 Tax=Thermaerobacter composti TaxID=554949 RepID=A0ABZ0QN09_9FIRM|nr:MULTISPECIES: Uma2 family endonuclease [Thermaerobacter]WPD18786.1 Uma2 family endonuclease [Thermaerobacter composti]